MITRHFFIFLIHYLHMWHATHVLTWSKLTKMIKDAKWLNFKRSKL